MNNRGIISSAKMAFAFGVLLPVAETIRRINHILDPSKFLSWFDDYLLGALLILAAYAVLKAKKHSAAYLITAWSIATAGLLWSFLGQLSYYNTPTGEPGIFSTTFVAVAKAILLVYCIIGLVLAIRAGSKLEHF